MKAGRITHLSDARYCAGMGVDMLGFTVGGSEGLSFEKFKEINQWVTGPQIVIEPADKNTLTNVLETFYADHFEIPSAWLTSVPANTSLLVKVSLSEEFAPMLRPVQNQIHALVIESYSAAQKEVLQHVGNTYKVMIDVDSSSVPLNELLELPLFGLVVSGSEELKPGLKNFDQLASVLEQLEID